MTDNPSQASPPAPPAFPLPAAEPRLVSLSRECLQERRQRDIVRGRAMKADVWLSTTAEGRPVVVKDFLRKPPWGRLWGWLQVRREARALCRVAELDVAPRIVGGLGSLALVLEYYEGELLARRGAGEDNAGGLDRLRRCLETIHLRGITHNDLRGRGNILLRTDGSVILLDWAGALYLRPGSLPHRLLFGLLSRVDESAYLKWKSLLDPASMSEQERLRLRRFRRWRLAWPFNRKGLGETSLLR